MSTRVLGIDPGSRITGFGVVEIHAHGIQYLASGCVRTENATFVERLKTIFEGVAEVVRTYAPTEIAIEKVFVQRNVDSALKLGQARGAALCAGVSQAVPIFEYSPTEIKQALVGRGRAEKLQVQHMVKTLLNLEGSPQADAADALACAICHCHTHYALAYFKRFARL